MQLLALLAARVCNCAFHLMQFAKHLKPSGKLYMGEITVLVLNPGCTDWALLHKSDDGRTSPFPGQTYPATSVTGVPRAVNSLRTATRTWTSAT